MVDILNRCRVLTGNKLKVIALITMIIDHIGYCLIFRLMVCHVQLPFAYTEEQLMLVYNLCRKIGRIAFPIFCFLLVEGFKHTSNIWKYIGRIGIIALISEPVFNLACGANIRASLHQNTFWTLFLGLIMLYCMSLCENKYNEIQSKEDRVNKKQAKRGKKVIYYSKYSYLVIEFVTIGIFAYLSELCKVDYKIWGIVWIALIYLFDSYFKHPIMGCFGCFIGMICRVIKDSFERPALFAFIPMALYNGQRGSKNKVITWLFYVAYPVHLAILYLLMYYFGVNTVIIW